MEHRNQGTCADAPTGGNKVPRRQKKKKDYWKLIIYCRKTLSNWLGCFINYGFLWDEIRYWYCKLSHSMSYLMLPFAKINWTVHFGQSSFKMLLCCLSTAEQFALNWIPYIQNLCLKKKTMSCFCALKFALLLTNKSPQSGLWIQNVNK